jgi:hypothetical protein
MPSHRVRRSSGDSSRRAVPDHLWGVVATVVLAAALGAVTWFAWWWPFALVVACVAVASAAMWIRWIVRRDARAVVALWLIFALNRSLALILPPGLYKVTLSLDDIALAVALGVLLMTGARLRPGTRAMTVAYIGFGVFLVSGVVGAAAAGSSVTVTVLGTWFALKLFVCLVVASQFRWRERDTHVAIQAAIWLIVVTLAVAVLQWVAPEIVNAIFRGEERTRLGARVLTSIFRHPAHYSTFMVFSLAILLARYPLTPRKSGQALVVGAAALLSLRLKALVDVVLLLGARVAISPARSVKFRAPLVLLAGGVAAAFVGSGLLAARIGVLFGTQDESARRILYETSGRIAKDFFPFGGGFGSFGSEASLMQYSPLYAQYGLSDRYGFSSESPIFVHDASWATVLGEAGLIGFVGFAVALIALLGSAWQRARLAGTTRRGDVARAAMLFALAFVSDSLTTPQLFAGFACMTLATLLSMSSASEISAPRTVGSLPSPVATPTAR